MSGEKDGGLRRVTFRAHARQIELAGERARAEGTTLDGQAGQWLARYACGERQLYEAMALLDELRTRVRVERKYTRDEMNERGPRL